MSVKKTNVIVVVSDTLRTASLGCYGNKTVRTPNIDRFAGSAAVFTEAYPESLPTIPVRRALHTGRRAFPFAKYRPLPWDIVYLPGWQPMDDDESTLAEDLAHGGYHTGFVTDTLPYFAPGMNFTRGFYQWQFIRGQQQDRWASVHAADPSRLGSIHNADAADPYNSSRYHVANTDGYLTAETTCTARTFQWAMKFLEDNQPVPFYLMIDCFDPHEPWEAPPEYYRLYADGNYQGKTIVHFPYEPDLAGLTEQQIADAKAHYYGLITLVDEWFGRLLDKLDELALTGSTMVIFTSDHGTNFGNNLWSVVGKPSQYLLPGTMHLPLIVRDPAVSAQGKRIDGLRYNTDVPATVYAAAGVKPSQPIDGNNLLEALKDDPYRGAQAYVTSLYDHTAWYRDQRWWITATVDGGNPHVFDLQADPKLSHDLADGGLKGESAEAFKLAWEKILKDAGGRLNDYSKTHFTDAIGQKPTSL